MGPSLNSGGTQDKSLPVSTLVVGLQWGRR